MKLDTSTRVWLRTAYWTAADARGNEYRLPAGKDGVVVSVSGETARVKFDCLPDPVDVLIDSLATDPIQHHSRQ